MTNATKSFKANVSTRIKSLLFYIILHQTLGRQSRGPNGTLCHPFRLEFGLAERFQALALTMG